MAGRTSRRIGCFAVIFLLALTGAVVGVAWLRQQQHLSPLQFEQRCEARVGSTSVVLTRDQAYYTSIIVGTAVRRGLGEPGGTVAMATVYQETGIRNLDYGDRDSLGLFQQRPSQNWGTPEQVMDPWYSTNKFFDALVKIKGWETADVNDTAQAVQRSGFPEAYRQHEDNARILSKVFIGAEAAGLSCFDERAGQGDQPGFVTELDRTFGVIDRHSEGNRLTLIGGDATHGWALAAYAVAHAGVHGIVSVETDSRSWTADQRSLPKWRDGSPVPPGTVVITFR